MKHSGSQIGFHWSDDAYADRHGERRVVGFDNGQDDYYYDKLNQKLYETPIPIGKEVIDGEEVQIIIRLSSYLAQFNEFGKEDSDELFQRLSAHELAKYKRRKKREENE